MDNMKAKVLENPLPNVLMSNTSGVTLAALAEKLELSHHGCLVAIHHVADGHMTLKVVQDRPFMCVLCGSSFMHAATLVEHARAEHDYCEGTDGESQGFETDVDLDKFCHRNVQHSVDKASTSGEDVILNGTHASSESEQIPNSSHVSNVCKLPATDGALLTNDENVILEETERIVTKASRIDPTIHSDGEITANEENDQDSDNHVCNYCKKKFISEEKLLSHGTRHCGKSHKCYVCKVAYSLESTAKERITLDADAHQQDSLTSVGSSIAQGLEELPVATEGESKESRVLSDGQGIDCVMCGETFGILQHMLQHIHSYESFPCTFCDKEYSSMRDLGWHCKDKHDLLVVRCPFCSRGFREYSHLAFHMREHKGHLSCKVCKVQCLSRTSFNAHVELHKRNQIVQDEEGEEEKQNMDSEADSVQKGEKKQVCHVCSKLFNSFYSMFHHMRKEHPKESIPSYNQDLIKRRFVCKKCGFAFRRKDTLERHEAVHKRGDYPRRKPPPRPIVMPKPGNLLCTVCGRAFLRMTNLEAHMERTHPNDCDDMVKNKKKFCCDQCGKLLMSQKSLDRHILVHQEPKFTCPICNKKLKHQETLKTHIRTHTGEKPYSCHECNQAFAQRSTYVQHMCIHTGERPHRCAVCNKTFIRKTELRLHEAKHSNLRLFPCSFCSKTFKTEKHRKVHETQLHSSKAQTYVCEKCGKSFTWASGLKAHACSHIGEAPYKCKECNKAFSQPLFLKRHMQVHNKPFKCEHCYESFKAGSDLRNHLTQAHGCGLTNQVQSLVPNQFQTSIPEQSWKATKVMMEIGLDPNAPLATQLSGPLLQGTVQMSLPNQGQGPLQSQAQIPHPSQAHASVSGQVNVPLSNALSGQPQQQFLPDTLIHDRSMFLDPQFQVQDSTNQTIAAMLTQMSTL